MNLSEIVRAFVSVWVRERGAECSYAVDNTCKWVCVNEKPIQSSSLSSFACAKTHFSGTRVQSVKQSRHKTKINKKQWKRKKMWSVDDIEQLFICDIEFFPWSRLNEFSVCVLYLPLDIISYSAAVAMSRRCFNSSYQQNFRPITNKNICNVA